ncbi:translocation/assembly module TamB domain-containing protein [Kineobactrum salinum]|uniref:translocation/assembly module TamB domain-containing protein n=1 Tax=Kineobactrum salinum TaxID=2708301 RepID=UPI001E3AD4F7|nr:hypothetical protein [Kineobactrum salinum]
MDLASEGWGSVQLQGDLELGGAWPLALKLALEFARPEPVPEVLWERSVSLRLDGQADELELSLALPGTPRGELRAQVDLLDPGLPFQLTAMLAGEEPLALAQILGPNEALPELALALPWQLDARGNLSAQSVETTATVLGAGYQALRLDAQLSHHDQRLQIVQLQLSDEASDSRLQVDGSVSYGAVVKGELALQSAGFALPELGGPLKGRLAGGLLLAGQWHDQEWQLALDEVDMEGEVNGLPAQADGALQLNSQDYVAAGELQVDINAAELVLSRGQGSGGTAALALRVEDLARWQAGSRGRLVLEGELREQASTLDLKGSIDNLSWNGLTVDQGELQGELALAPAGAMDARLELKQLRLGELYLEQMALVAGGTYEAPSLELRSSGDISGVIRLVARQQDDAWVGQLATTGIDTPLGPLTLEQDVTFRYTDSSVQVAAHCWRLPESRLCSEDWTLAASGGGSARLEGDLALFAALLPQDLDVSGSLAGQVSAQWAPATGLRASVSLDSFDGELTQFYPEGESASLRWESVQARLEQGSEGLTLSATVQREQQTALQLDVQLPPEREQGLAGSVEINEFQLAVLRPFIPDLARLEGVLAGRLRVAGTLDAPELFGRLQLIAAEVGLNSNPTELTAVELVLDLSGDRADLEGSANLGGVSWHCPAARNCAPNPRWSCCSRATATGCCIPPAPAWLPVPTCVCESAPGSWYCGGSRG